MSVLVVAGSKGGSGKTLVSLCLSAYLGRTEADFALVDADPTKAASRWAAVTYEGKAFAHHAEEDEDRLAHLISDLRSRHKLVLVDTPGFANLSSSVAIASADHVLIPCKASEADLYEARTTSAKVASLAVTTRRDIPVRAVLNSVRATSVAGHAAQQIAEAGIRTLTSTLGHRADFEALTHTGRSPQVGAAFREISALAAELQYMSWL
ncbi:MAG: division plane positioning ATPase MipZ [Janthinobacterium lividum]